MMWREVEVKWKDETLRVRPTFELLQSIEQIDDLETLVTKGVQGKFPATTACEIVAAVLRAAGKPVGAEDVFSDPEMNAGLGYARIVAFNALSAFANGGREEAKPEAGEPKKK